MRNIATLLRNLHTTHDPIKEGWDVFDVNSSGALEIEAVNESDKFDDDDMAATNHVIRAALEGDPHALRGLLILMARIAEPVIDEAIRINSEGIPRRLSPFSVLLPSAAAATASMAVAE
jgi:hypothetical protein